MRKTADDMDISDFEFDQYLEGDSSLSQAYRSAARAVEPSVNVEKIVLNELDSFSNSRVQIPRLETPATGATKKVRKEGYGFRWLGPVMGAVCVAVLAVGLGLRTGLYDDSESIASNDQSQLPQSGSAETQDESIVAQNTDEQLLAQVDSVSEVTPEEQDAFQNTMTQVATGSEESAGQGLSSDSPSVVANEITPTTSTANEGAVDMRAGPEPVSDDQFAQQQSQVTQPSVMAPANAMLEADGPRSPAVMDSDSLLETQDLVETSPVATGIAIASRRDRSLLEQSENPESATTDVAIDSDQSNLAPTTETVTLVASDSTEMSEQQLADALVQTEKAAETLESRNSALRNELAALEEKVFNATIAGAETSQLQSSADSTGQAELTSVMAEQQNRAAVTDSTDTAQLKLALNAVPSQSEQGRQLALLSTEEISQLLATDSNRESYRDSLLSVIGAANRSNQTERLEALLEIYRQTYPDSLPLTPDLLQ